MKSEPVYYRRKHIGFVELSVQPPFGPVWWGKTLDDRYTDLGSKERATKSVVDRYKSLLKKAK